MDCLSILCKAGENGRDSKGRPTIAVSLSTTGAIAQRPYRSWERKGASCSPRAGRAQTHSGHPPGLCLQDREPTFPGGVPKLGRGVLGWNASHPASYPYRHPGN